MAAPESAPVYEAAPGAYAQPAGGDFNTLHDFASLPVCPAVRRPRAGRDVLPCVVPPSAG